VRSDSANYSFAYGIDVQAGAGENQVGPNDLHRGGVIANFHDAGINTRQGMIVYSPNGTAYNIKVANDGTVSTSVVVTS
jgi:hypothetical protein